MELLDTYNNLNNSYKTKLVYHLGSEAGFFSEYNNMILAMLYCLKNKIKFELYSKDSNFCYKEGWQDYFLPFCNESTDIRHSKYNLRQPLLDYTFIEKLRIYWFKLRVNTNYLTYELWDKFHNKKFESEHFNILNLNIDGSIIDAASKLIFLTWEFKEDTKKEISNLVSSLALPSKYIGIHIRRGDKYIETKNIEIDKYIDSAKSNSDVTDIFVATDDYQTINELRGKYPNLNFFTLCPKNKFGYFQGEFNKLNTGSVKNEMIELFATIELLLKSEIFIGTYSSNIGMFIGLRMDQTKVHSVDFEKWTIW